MPMQRSINRVFQSSAIVLLCITGMFNVRSANAQEATSGGIHPPPLGAMPELLDWSYYCNPAHQKEYSGSLKCIHSDHFRGVTASVGGEIRERGEYSDHPTWGQDPPDNGYSLQRYALYEDIHFGSNVRVFSELESALEYGRDGGPRSVIDQDQLFVHQTFIDLNLWKSGENHLTLRSGRQELSFGADRLVSIREGPNVLQNFDGFRLSLVDHGWKADLLATKYSESNPGVFDDSPNHAYSFWGLYTTHPLFALKGTNVDLYYFGTDKKSAKFAQGIGREQRETVGTRISGRHDRFDYDTEGTFQFGRFGSGNIRAWALATNSGYTFGDSSPSVKLRVALEGGVASGDHNLHDNTLGTFNALFPKGAYFNEAELLGPYNIVHLRPNVKVELNHHLTVWPDASFFWRQSHVDAIYRVPEILQRPAGSASATYIGSQANVEIDWHPTRHFTYTLIYLHFFPGAFLKQSQPSKDVNFVAPWITYRF